MGFDCSRIDYESDEKVRNTTKAITEKPRTGLKTKSSPETKSKTGNNNHVTPKYDKTDSHFVNPYTFVPLEKECKRLNIEEWDEIEKNEKKYYIGRSCISSPVCFRIMYNG